MEYKKIKFGLCALLLAFCGFTIVESGDNDMSTKEITKCIEEVEETKEVVASHILVKTELQAKELLTQIKDGKISFEDAAKKFSTCPSGANGGDLGRFGRNAMVKEFEDAAFSTEKGEISAPVKTQFGWHLIKIIDKIIK